MRLVRSSFAIGMSAALVLGAALAGSAILSVDPKKESAGGANRPVWAQAEWLFPNDPWGKGKAFRCKAPDCDSEVHLYVRAKLGFCNCTTGVADDEDLRGMGDLQLIAGQATPVGAGRPITIGSMNGRTRIYRVVSSQGGNQTVISIVFNQRCDMVAATAVLSHGGSPLTEPAVLDFLNSDTILKWVDTTLGL
jgi:hypothetical protein